MIFKFIIFQLLLVVPFCAGVLVRGRFTDSREISRKLISLNLASIEPLVVLWSVWGISMKPELAVLPAAGLLLVLAGLVLGFPAAGVLGLTGTKKHTFIISSSLANHGFTLGGFLCYLFFGETGLGYSFIFISYFMPYVFIFVFPAARALSGLPPQGKQPVRYYVCTPQNLPLAAVILAVVLPVAGVQRPAVEFPMDFFLMVSVAVYYFSLGLTFSFGFIMSVFREFICFSVIRFIMLPLLTGAVLWWLNLDREIKGVILLQSFMPAAIYSVVVSVLFRMDDGLASGLFVVSTVIFMGLILPAMFILRPWDYVT